jgi:hypothetical protein
LIVIFKFFEIKYIVADVKSYRELFEYIIKIIAAAKTYGYADTEYVQMLQIYRELNTELRKWGVNESKIGITVQEFIKLLNAKKMNWFNYYSDSDSFKQSQNQIKPSDRQYQQSQ